MIYLQLLVSAVFGYLWSIIASAFTGDIRIILLAGVSAFLAILALLRALDGEQTP